MRDTESMRGERKRVYVAMTEIDNYGCGVLGGITIMRIEMERERERERA